MSRQRGFTLLELVIAIFIVLLLLGLAVPSISGVFADKRLHRSFDRFNALVRQAHERSLEERRAYLIVLDEHNVSLVPAIFRTGELHHPFASFAWNGGEKWQMELPAALTKDAPAQWVFWESGVCEPARIKFSGNDGSWVADYAPLTALPGLVAYASR